MVTCTERLIGKIKPPKLYDRYSRVLNEVVEVE